MRWSRRISAVLVVVVVGALAGWAPAAAAGPRPHPGWKLRWSADASRDGLAAFEHSEDDRAHSHPQGGPHIKVADGHYRFDMHMVDVDTSTDRQRHEVRGLVADHHTVTMLKGETWRIAYSLFIPDTHKATTTFNHIMQTKAPGTGTGPMLVQSLRRYGTVPKIEVKLPDTNTLIGVVDLAPLQNHWIDIQLDMKIGDAPDGWVRWVVRDGDTTVIDTTSTGVDNWLFDRVRMKWGIYRSLRDTSGSLEDTYMLIDHLRAYQWSNDIHPPVVSDHEAELGVVTQGKLATSNGGYSGGGYVDLDDVAGASVQWTVRAQRPGPVTLNIWYANADPIERPMDIAVNGVDVEKGLVFFRTPAWDDWETRTVTVMLQRGDNTIRATATTAAGGPNLDKIEMQQPPLPDDF